MWVARDEFGDLSLFDEYPKRQNGFWVYDTEETLFGFCIEDESLFPNLKWEDEPVEVELHIKK